MVRSSPSGPWRWAPSAFMMKQPILEAPRSMVATIEGRKPLRTFKPSRASSRSCNRDILCKPPPKFRPSRFAAARPDRHRLRIAQVDAGEPQLQEPRALIELVEL